MSNLAEYFARYRDDGTKQQAYGVPYITRSADGAHSRWFDFDFFSNTDPAPLTSAPEGETARSRRARFRNKDTFERETDRERQENERSKIIVQQAKRDFLKTRPIKNAAEYKRQGWRGTRVLGQGGQGIVGLWEWKGRRGPVPQLTQIVVKKHERDVKHERKMMMKLRNEGNHTVRLLYPQLVTDPTDDQRIILEFCSGGDLQTLLHHHKETKLPFSEEQLWSVFSCLAKGLSVMNHGTEEPTRDVGVRRHAVCHFDLKPRNIFLGETDDIEHPEFPICKIGDFGLASFIPIRAGVNGEILKGFRRVGTSGWLAPEQFTRRWQYPNWRQSFAGHYATHTNIWGVGAIMYQLMTLGGPPVPKEIRITDPEEGLGHRYTYLSYGDKLHRLENYSSHLKMLIWRCLAEKPVDRPDLDVLYSSIRLALEYFQKENVNAVQAVIDEPREENPAQPDVHHLADPRATGTFRFRIYFAGYSHPSKLTKLARAQNAWFEADRTVTVGELKHAICTNWMPDRSADGMQEQHLFLRVSGDRSEDKLAVEDDMTLWGWGVRNMSIVHMDHLPGDFFIGAR